MKALKTAIILAGLALAVSWASAQNAGTAQNQGAGNGGNAAQSALRILAPATGQVINQNFVTVKYELTNSGVSGGSPNYRIQLDSRDPVTTTFTEYTFTGLQPGAHSVSVQLVDANNTPVTNARGEVHFNVVQPRTPAPGASVATRPMGRLRKASIVSSDDDDLPPASSALPLLSVIGFGALLGGIASALKTR